MAGILKILQPKEKGSSIGVVTASRGNNNYTVSIRGRQINVRSVLSKKLIVGSKVILTRTDEETYIIGDDSVRKKGQVEIPVNG